MSTRLTNQKPDAAALENAAREFEGTAPEHVIAWALQTYHPRIVLACSFGGPTGMVLLDIVMSIDRSTPVYYLDTGLLFPETHALIKRVVERYAISPIAVTPALSVDEQNRVHGNALWQTDPDTCCSMRKIAPQRAFLRDYDAWISGVRRDQVRTRSAVPIVHWDSQFGVAKINPLAHWDERMVWTYIHAHDVPYNELHDRGYPSLGCVPCTRAITQGEDLRAGRWPSFNKVECGLHVEKVQNE